MYTLILTWNLEITRILSNLISLHEARSFNASNTVYLLHSGSDWREQLAGRRTKRMNERARASQSASRARTWRVCLLLLRRDIHAPLDTRTVLNNDISASLWYIVYVPADTQCKDLSFIQAGIREFDNSLSGMREVNARHRGADSHRLLLSKCHGILVLPIEFHRWNIRLLTWAARESLALASVYIAAKGNR